MSGHRATQLVEAGLWLRLSGDAEGARRLFEQALKLDPANARARQLLEQAPGTAPQAAELPFAPPKPDGEAGSSASASSFSNPFVRPEATPTPGPAEVSLPRSGVIDPNPFARREPPPPPLEVDFRSAETDMMVTAPDLRLDWGQATGLSLDESPPATEPMGRALQGVPPRPTSAWDSPSDPGISVDLPDPVSSAVMDLVVSDEPAAEERAAPLDDRQQVEALLQGAQDLVELDDHSGALELLTKAADLAPGEPKIQRLREHSEHVLQAMFESKIGRMDARPRVTMKDDEIIWLNLDHRAGFVLAQIDGTVTFEDLFSVSGMSRLDTARILAQLVDEGVISAA